MAGVMAAARKAGRKAGAVRDADSKREAGRSNREAAIAMDVKGGRRAVGNGPGSGDGR